MHQTIVSIHNGRSHAVKLRVRQLAKLLEGAHLGRAQLQVQVQVRLQNHTVEVFLGLILQIGPSITKHRTRIQQKILHQLLAVLITLTSGLCTSVLLLVHLQCPTGQQIRLATALMTRSFS